MALYSFLFAIKMIKKFILQFGMVELYAMH